MLGRELASHDPGPVGRRWRALGALIAVALAASAPSGGALADPQISFLHSFGGQQKGDGASPYSGLVMGPDGALYGTTPGGGADGDGVVWKLTPPAAGQSVWTESILHSFGPASGTAPDGAFPYGALAIDQAGALYGTTEEGGPPLCSFGSGPVGCGTVFKLTPPTSPGGTWTETQIYVYDSIIDDQPGFIGPTTGLVLDQTGRLWGSDDLTGFPSPGAAGSIYSLTPPTAGAGKWTITLYPFSPATTTPTITPPSARARLLIDASGNLFYPAPATGIYEFGPATGYAPLLLYAFHSYVTGLYPEGGLAMDAAGNLYGTTSDEVEGNSINGFGTVFKLTPPAILGEPWRLVTLHQFTGGSDGDEPYGDVAIDQAGNLYGTTYLGGGGSGDAHLGAGTVWKLTAPAAGGGAWSYSVLHRFTYQGGAAPEGAIAVDAAGTVYGTTQQGGDRSCANGCGTVFKLTQ